LARPRNTQNNKRIIAWASCYPIRKRKTAITIVHYDAIPDNADAEFSQAILTDRKRVPLDEYVIQKVDFDRFINGLSRKALKQRRHEIFQNRSRCLIYSSLVRLLLLF